MTVLLQDGDGTGFERTAIAVAVGVVAALKVALYIHYAPYILAHNEQVLRYADAILAGPSWLFDAEETISGRPYLIWRPVGYPLVVALTKLIGGGAWYYLLFAIQGVVGLVAAGFVYALARRLGLSPVFAVAAFLMHGLAVSLSNDLILLADSLSAGLYTVAICWLVIEILDDGPRRRTLWTAGIMLAACFLLRDSFIYIGIVSAAGLFGVLAVLGRSPLAAAKAAAVFAAPLIVCAVVVLAWNHARTGHAFITTGGQTGYLFAVLKIAEHEPAVFGSDSLLDRVAREGFIDYDDADTVRINGRLTAGHGISPIEASALAKDKFWNTVASHPGAFAASLIGKLHFKHQAPLLGDPLKQIDELDSWARLRGGPDYLAGWRGNAKEFLASLDLRVLEPSTVVHALPRFAMRIATTTLYFVFLIAVPIAAVYHGRAGRQSGQRRVWALVAALWLLYHAVLMIYAPVNVTTRYLGPVGFVPILGSLVFIQDAAARLISRRRADRI